MRTTIRFSCRRVDNFAGAGEQVVFDIFRFNDDGKIAEHWDNLAVLAAERKPSGHTQIDGTMELTDLDKTEENRELVKNFLYDVMQGNNLDKTPNYFHGDTYIQHNTGIADGVSGLNAALSAMAEQGRSTVYNEVHMVLAQGNYVLGCSAKEPLPVSLPAIMICGVWKTVRLLSTGLDGKPSPISPNGRIRTASSDRYLQDAISQYCAYFTIRTKHITRKSSKNKRLFFIGGTYYEQSCRVFERKPGTVFGYCWS